MGAYNLQDAAFPVAVIGAGTMGAGIAQIAAQAGHPVALVDASQAALDRAKSGHAQVFAGLVAKGKRTAAEADAVLARMTYTPDMQFVNGAMLVIEAVVERADVKAELFAAIEQRVAPEAVLATNTSSLAVTGVAAACTRPERVIGLHFFNPAPVMALVEVIPALQTDPSLPPACHDLLLRWGKEPARALDTPGFIVNRVARPFYGEALRCLEEGRATPTEIDGAMRHLGFRMGPFELMDLIGNDVNFAVTKTVFEATFADPRYRPSVIQERLVQAGWLGRKTGRGHYSYDAGPPAPEPKALPEVGDRVLAMLINEAADAVFLGIATAADVDRAMVRGVNYPQGLCAWSDTLGPEWTVQRIDALRDRTGDPRYRCSPLLRDQCATGTRFFA